MRRRVVFALIAGVSIAGGFVACGIDEQGEADDGGSDATSKDAPTTNDAPLDVPIDVPQACKTLDATSCVGDASLPDGWTYAVITPGDQLCPTTVDYDKTDYLANLVAQGPCLCTCAASGTIDCSGQLEAGSGGTCNDMNKWFVFDAGNDAACINTNWGDPHFAVPAPPTSFANAQCDASAPAPGWSASVETSCTPKCTADFCNVGNTYKRCIISAQSQLCPAPFTVPQPVFGIEAGVSTACTGCTCGVSGKCSATIQAFNSNSCNNAVSDAAPANGTCDMTGIGGSPGQVNSFTYVPSVPQPGCAISASATPSAQFASTVTVCCLP
jgi:hypothetical protein